MSVGNTIRLVLQAVYFVLVARALGPSQYGAFVGVVALIGIATSFASLGFGGILIKHTSRDVSRFETCWGNALFMTATVGVGLLSVVLATTHFLLGNKVPLDLVAMVAIADLFFSPVVTLAGQAFMAVERLHGTASTAVVLGATRTIAAILLGLTVSRPTAVTWALFYMLSSGLAAIYAFGEVMRQLGAPKLALHNIRQDLSEGIYFAVGASSQTVYNDIDKTMLVRLSELSAAGIYGTAYRVIDTAFQPVTALLAASYARVFKAGEKGLKQSIGVGLKILPHTLAYSVLVALVLYFTAPVLPIVLGHGFSDSVEALRWLLPLTAIRALHYNAANSLAGAGFQGSRAAVQISIAVVNVGLNFWLIPAYSWRGAAWASIASDGLLAVSLWGLAYVYVCSEKNELSNVAGLPLQ